VVVLLLVVLWSNMETFVSAPMPLRIVPHDPNKIPLSEKEFNQFYFGQRDYMPDTDGDDCVECGMRWEAPKYW
jgi:hypothetical protein